MNQNSSQLFFHGFSKSKLVNCRCHSGLNRPHTGRQDLARHKSNQSARKCKAPASPTAGTRLQGLGPTRHGTPAPSFQHPHTLNPPSTPHHMRRLYAVASKCNILLKSTLPTRVPESWREIGGFDFYSELGLPRILFSCKLHKSDKSDLGSKPSSSRVTTFLRLFFNTF